jgi:hypothetical protein
VLAGVVIVCSFIFAVESSLTFASLPGSVNRPEGILGIS